MSYLQGSKLHYNVLTAAQQQMLENLPGSNPRDQGLTSPLRSLSSLNGLGGNDLSNPTVVPSNWPRNRSASPEVWPESNIRAASSCNFENFLSLFLHIKAPIVNLEIDFNHGLATEICIQVSIRAELSLSAKLVAISSGCDSPYFKHLCKATAKASLTHRYTDIPLFHIRLPVSPS